VIAKVVGSGTEPTDGELGLRLIGIVGGVGVEPFKSTPENPGGAIYKIGVLMENGGGSGGPARESPTSMLPCPWRFTIPAVPRKNSKQICIFFIVCSCCIKN
jgi:hypothetical protein